MGHAPVPALLVHSVVAKTTLDITTGTRTFTVPDYNSLTITMQGGGGGGWGTANDAKDGQNATISFTGFSSEADGGTHGDNLRAGFGGGSSNNNTTNTAGAAGTKDGGAGAAPTGGAGGLGSVAGNGAAGHTYGGGGGGSVNNFGGGGGGYGKNVWTAATAGAPAKGTVITYTVPTGGAGGTSTNPGGAGAQGYVQFAVA